MEYRVYSTKYFKIDISCC